MKIKQKKKSWHLYGVVLFVIVIVLLLLKWSNMTNKSKYNQSINNTDQMVWENKSTDQEISIYYFKSNQKPFNLVMSNWSNFEDLKKNNSLVYLTNLDADSEYFSITDSSYLDSNTKDLYIGLLKVKGPADTSNCNYITDIVKINLETNNYNQVYRHNDCTNTLPNVAPAKVIKVVDGRYLTMSVALCSECGNQGPEKTFVVDVLAR